MFTINLEDGREAPSQARKKGAKRLEFLVCIIRRKTPQCCPKPCIAKLVNVVSLNKFSLDKNKHYDRKY